MGVPELEVIKATRCLGDIYAGVLIRLVMCKCCQMDVRNLAIIFGPTLLQLRDDNVIRMVKDMSNQCQIVEAVVLHVSEFLLSVTM